MKNVFIQFLTEVHSAVEVNATQPNFVLFDIIPISLSTTLWHIFSNVIDDEIDFI